LTPFPFFVTIQVTYLTGVVTVLEKPKHKPEIKPVEPDPDNAGVGNK